MLYKYVGICLHNGLGSLQLIKSFCGGCPGGGFFKKSPLEIVKGPKRVRSVGWAG